MRFEHGDSSHGGDPSDSMSECVVNVSHEEINAVARALRLVETPRNLAVLKEVLNTFCPNLLRKLQAFRDDSDGVGYLLLRAIPVDEPVCPTPSGLRTNEIELAPISERLLLAEASVLGEVISYEGEGEGALIHDVCPVRDHAESHSSMGSQEPLDIHTELVNLIPFEPLYVCLYCVRTSEETVARTQLLPLTTVVGCLPGRSVEALRRPEFGVSPPYSFTESASVPAISILSGFGKFERLAVELQSMHPITEGAAKSAKHRLTKSL